MRGSGKMYESTKRFLDMAWRLQTAGIRYGLDPDPDLAILISFQDAQELYYDLLKANTFEIHRYQIADFPPMEVEKRQIYYPDLGAPPYPDGKRVVWCSVEGVKIAIKGKEDE